MSTSNGGGAQSARNVLPPKAQNGGSKLNSSAVQTLTCRHNGHTWHRTATQGRPPYLCPSHAPRVVSETRTEPWYMAVLERLTAPETPADLLCRAEASHIVREAEERVNAVIALLEELRNRIKANRDGVGSAPAMLWEEMADLMVDDLEEIIIATPDPADLAGVSMLLEDITAMPDDELDWRDEDEDLNNPWRDR